MKVVKLLGEGEILHNVVSDYGDRILVEPQHYRHMIKPREVVNKRFITEIVEQYYKLKTTPT